MTQAAEQKKEYVVTLRVKRGAHTETRSYNVLGIDDASAIRAARAYEPGAEFASLREVEDTNVSPWVLGSKAEARL